MNKHKNEHRQQYSGITCLMAFYFCSAGCPSQAFEGDTDDEFKHLQTVQAGSIVLQAGSIVFAFRRHLFREVS